MSFSTKFSKLMIADFEIIWGVQDNDTCNDFAEESILNGCNQKNETTLSYSVDGFDKQGHQGFIRTSSAITYLLG